MLFSPLLTMSDTFFIMGRRLGLEIHDNIEKILSESFVHLGYIIKSTLFRMFYPTEIVESH